MAEIPNHLAKLLSDFLLDYSKAKLEGLDRHPLIETPVMQRLTAEYLDRQPAHRALPAQDVAMGALGEYWARVFKPDRLTLAFRDEWRRYLLLAVAYFVPFRRQPAQERQDERGESGHQSRSGKRWLPSGPSGSGRTQDTALAGSAP